MTNIELGKKLMAAYERAEECGRGSAWMLSTLLYLRERRRGGKRVICTGRVIAGGAVELFALISDDEYQFIIADDEKMCKPGLGADPDFLKTEG